MATLAPQAPVRARLFGRRQATAPAPRLVLGPGDAPARSRRVAAPATPARREVLTLEALVTAITVFGLVMVLSASSVVSIEDYGSPWSLFVRQVIWTVLGLVAFVVARRCDLATVRRFSTPLLLVSFFLLFVVLVPHLGQVSGGSSRWIGAGPIKIQPSEFAKLAFALFGADLLARRHAAPDFFRSVLRPLVLVLGVGVMLIIKQPDLGTAIVLLVIAFAVLYAGGIHRHVLIGFASVALFGAGVLALAAPYRRDRLFSYINPFAHASTSGYQVVQSLTALGSGHLVGAGLGASLAKWFLPNAQTDFIFAVIGNELGFIGTVAVIALFVAIGLIGLRIAARATDRFAAYLATAITCWIVAQAFINIGGVIGILPETGIPLPFLSFGGSSLVVALAAMGLLVNIAEPRRRPARAAVARSARRNTKTARPR